MPSCPNCGHQNTSGKFCIKCGTRLAQTPPQPSKQEELPDKPPDQLLAASEATPITSEPMRKASDSRVPEPSPAPSEETASKPRTFLDDRKRLVTIVSTAIGVMVLGVFIFQRLTQRHSEEATYADTPSQTASETSSNSSPSSVSPDITVPQPAPPESWRITEHELFAIDGSPRNATIAQLITDLESANGEGSPLTKQELMDLIARPEAQIVYSDKILKYATPVSLDIQKKEHEDYTRIFMKESYQKAGLEFLKTHREYLDRAEEGYGVLRRDIVSVLIWESGLGKFTGDFREFNVFLGLILFLDRAQESAVQKMIAEGKPNPLDDPLRAARERKRLDKRKAESVANLVALLRIAKQIGADPLSMTGSWGGAIGYVQFMPSNLKYAIDGDGDGNVNLSTWPDAIMSVAYYLKTLGNYESTEPGRQRALLRYNPSKEYANGVKLVAETIWKRHLNGE